ncbi:MAG TPA: sigma-70 family RNA polymerase sigma factor [Verrucomicrobiae bacterium]|jgi:RNA polymerase sigma factor (sigma-70 family)|nr:sigma-70 family RNA polymerase sigma factor [Verrucomicrobiae bacterium]
MKQPDNELIPTRASLLNRLKDWQDNSSWQDFFRVYWKLIYGVARKSGLTDAEAQDVVQETLISVAKHMPTFKYDPSIGSFKAWLLTMTRWRIIGQFRKRRPMEEHGSLPGNSTMRTDAVEALPDPNALDVNQVWEAEWQTNLVNAAVEQLKLRTDPQRFQIFDFYVNKEWPPEKVAGRFGVSVDQVYQVKHRLTEAIRVEVERLQNEVT